MEQQYQSDPLQKEPSPAAAQKEPGVSVWKELVLLWERTGSCIYFKTRFSVLIRNKASTSVSFPIFGLHIKQEFVLSYKT